MKLQSPLDLGIRHGQHRAGPLRSHDGQFVEYMARRTVAGPIPHLRLYFTVLNARLPRSKPRRGQISGWGFLVK